MQSFSAQPHDYFEQGNSRDKQFGLPGGELLFTMKNIAANLVKTFENRQEARPAQGRDKLIIPYKVWFFCFTIAMQEEKTFF